MTQNLYELINLGKPFLRQYLEEHGITIVRRGVTDFFSCINPEHIDNNPSNGFVKNTNDEAFHCFACLASGDIYNAAHLLEGKPLHGIGFIKDNVEYILNRFQIPFQPLDISPEMLDRLKYETLYEAVAYLMSMIDPLSGELLYISTEHTSKRGWTEDTCRNLNIGSIKDFDKFTKALAQRTKLSLEEIKKMGIKQTMFGPDLITFCIRDHTKKIRGFVARLVTWNRESVEPKYRNTSLEDCPYYHKEELLYCIDLAKPYNMYRLDIFEGYGSAVTAHQSNYRHCVAIGGTALTEHHVELVRNLGFNHINLVLDQDNTGEKMMEKYIERFSGIQNLQVTVTHLPFTKEDKEIDGANDPDYFIKKYGINEYRKLKPIGAFEHMLKKYRGLIDIDGNPVFTKDFANQMIRLIINEPNHIERATKIKTLASVLSLEKDDIRSEIERLEKTDVKSLKDDLTKKLRNTSDHDQILDILTSATTSIQDSSSTKKERYLLSLTETIEAFNEVFIEMNELSQGTHGWKTGFGAFDSILDGIPKPTKGGTAIGLAGSPSHGKSAIMLNIATRLALHNNDIAICYWAIDDHRKAISYRLVSMISGVPMKKVRNTERRTSEEEKKIKEAQEIILEMINSRKLSFKDDRYGRSKYKAEKWIKETQDATGNPILFCIDSLHNVQGQGEETRVRLISSSGWAKSLTASVPCTVIATMELVKNRIRGERPSLMSISESGKMEFDFDTIGIVWHEAQGNYCDVKLVNNKWGSPDNWKPIIELSIQKNKAGSGEKGSVYFKYDPDTTRIVSCESYLDLSTQDYQRPNLLTMPVAVNYDIPSNKTNEWDDV